MPQVVDLCGGADCKVSCETLADDLEPPEERPPPAVIAAAEDPDFPPESIVIPIGDESDWPDINAVYDREDSTKGSTNPKSHSQPLHATKSRSNSTRIATANLKATASTPIIGLPGKIRRPGLACRRRTPQGRIFPSKRSDRGKKSAVPDSEPGSPKVSCIGKVLSDRERERCRRKRFERREKGDRVGCWSGFAAILHWAGGGGEHNAAAAEEEEEEKVVHEARRSPAVAVEKEAEADPPALGAMKWFASGRRAESWGDDVASGKEGHVADQEEGVWARLSVEEEE